MFYYFRSRARNIMNNVKSNSDVPSVTSLMITKHEDGKWMTTPWLDCGASEQYVVSYSLPFYGPTEDKLAKVK